MKSLRFNAALCLLSGILISFASSTHATEISTLGLLDHFDPQTGVVLNGTGKVSSWSNLAAPERSIFAGDGKAIPVQLANGRTVIRFDSPNQFGGLSYASPGETVMSGGYTILAVVALEPTSNSFPRVHRSTNDAHALFFSTSLGFFEVKANPLSGENRPRATAQAITANAEMLILTARVSSNSQELYMNGYRVAKASQSVSAYSTDTSTFQIGNSLVGRIGHILVYDNTAGQTVLNQTGKALAEIYGINWGFLQEAPLSVPVFTPPTPPLRPVVAHRGNSSVAPENTLASIRAAVGVAQMTEFDVYVTADQELIVIHDSTLNRTTNGSGNVASRNYWGDIDQLDAGSWFSPNFAGEPVPTMAEAVQLALSLGLTPVIERKTGSSASYYAKLDALGVLDKVHLISFDWGFLAQFRKLSPKTAIGALSYGPIERFQIQAAYSFGANYLDWAHWSLTPAEIALARSARLPIMVWTVNDVARAQQLYGMGVVSVTTDIPGSIIDLLPSFNGWVEHSSQGLSEQEKGFAMDPDRDGVPNALEMVFGSSPSISSSGVSELSREEDCDFVFNHSLSTIPSRDIFYYYRWSKDLVTWYGNGDLASDGTRVVMQPEVAVKRNPPLTDEIKVRSWVKSGQADRLFFRVEASR